MNKTHFHDDLWCSDLTSHANHFILIVVVVVVVYTNQTEKIVHRVVRFITRIDTASRYVQFHREELNI